MLGLGPRYANAQTGDTLTYLLDGSWCVGPDCSAPVGGATPVGVVMSIFEASWELAGSLGGKTKEVRKQSE